MLERTTAAGARPRPPSPFAWFEDLGFRRADLVVIGAEVRLIAAAGGCGVGGGQRRHAHTRGGAKALFRSPRGSGAGRHRLLVADGALPAIAAAACDRRWSRTRYAGVGAVWTEATVLAA